MPHVFPERTPRCPEGGVETRTGWKGCSNNTMWEGARTCDHTGPRVSITRLHPGLHVSSIWKPNGDELLPPATSPHMSP